MTTLFSCSSAGRYTDGNLRHLVSDRSSSRVLNPSAVKYTHSLGNIDFFVIFARFVELSSQICPKGARS